jgi:hypothetical protein
MDLGIRLFWLTIVLILIALPLETLHFGWERGLAIALLGSISVFVAYKWTVQSAKTYADLMHAAYDLYRFDLYSALRLEQPSASGDSEYELGQQLTKFLWSGDVEQKYQAPGKHKSGSIEKAIGKG